LERFIVLSYIALDIHRPDFFLCHSCKG